jgi:hypothetical protein
MLEDALQKHAADISSLLDGVTQRQMEPLISRLCAEQQWDLMAACIITAGEVSARLMINCLLDNGQYRALALPACLRRQQRRTDRLSSATLGATAFHDWDAEENTEGVPDHIRNEAEEIAMGASARRQVASYQAADVDRDPLREYIVTHLAERMNRESEALRALIIIARAAGWEETRRTAAMKIANNKRMVDKMISSGWIKPLVEVAESTNLQSARGNIARQMAAKLEDFIAQGNRVALEFLAGHLAEPELKAQAQAALEALPA